MQRAQNRDPEILKSVISPHESLKSASLDSGGLEFVLDEPRKLKFWNLKSGGLVLRYCSVLLIPKSEIGNRKSEITLPWLILWKS